MYEICYTLTVVYIIRIFIFRESKNFRKRKFRFIGDLIYLWNWEFEKSFKEMKHDDSQNENIHNIRKHFWIWRKFLLFLKGNLTINCMTTETAFFGLTWY